MPTNKLGLPLLTGNETADIPRDFNTLAEKIDEKAGSPDGLAQLDGNGKTPITQLPDASTSQKGATKLNDATNSTSTTEAATANAVKKVNDALVKHSAETTQDAHNISNITGLQTALNNKQDASADIAKFKKGSSSYTDRDTSQTFADAFCTIDSLVTVVITSATNPQGVWSVNSGNGSFTITSTAAETTNITFDYFIQKAVG